MLKNNLVGVDISDNSIKVLQLDEAYRVTAYGKTKLDKGIVHNGTIADSEAFINSFHSILETTVPNALLPSKNPLRSILSVPESKLYVHHLTFPESLHRDKMPKYIIEKAAKIIPFDIENLYYTYHVVREDKLQHVTFVGATKEVVTNYVDVITEAGVRPYSIGGSFFSLGRALLPDELEEQNYIIVDIGANFTQVGIFDIDAIASFSVQIPVGGKVFTDSIATKLDISMQEAEKIKQTQGMNPQEKKSTVFLSLSDNIKRITSEITEAKIYHEVKTGQKIGNIILAGGSALMPHLSKFVEVETGLTTTVANPFVKIKNHEVFGTDTAPIFYANVIGLALRGADDSLQAIDLLQQHKTSSPDEVRDLMRREMYSFSDARSLYVDVKNTLRAIFSKKDVRTHDAVLGMSHRAKLLLSIFFMVVGLALLLYVMQTYT